MPDVVIPYYIAGSICYDKTAQEMAPVNLALCDTRELVILSFETDPGNYLVVSADASVSPADILQHFQQFIKMYDEE